MGQVVCKAFCNIHSPTAVSFPLSHPGCCKIYWKGFQYSSTSSGPLAGSLPAIVIIVLSGFANIPYLHGKIFNWSNTCRWGLFYFWGIHRQWSLHLEDHLLRKSKIFFCVSVFLSEKSHKLTDKSYVRSLYTISEVCVLLFTVMAVTQST